MLRATPFVPFTVHLSNGRAMHVPHTDFAMLLQNGILFVNTEGDKVERIDPGHITSVESAETLGTAQPK